MIRVTHRRSQEIEPEIIFTKGDPYDYNHPWEGSFQAYGVNYVRDVWEKDPPQSYINYCESYYETHGEYPEDPPHPGLNSWGESFFADYTGCTGKQIVFEENNTYVHLMYRENPDGDRWFLKIVFKKSDVEYYDWY